MANPKFGVGYIEFAGLTKFDPSEQKEIQAIVNGYLRKFKRIAKFQKLRLHFKSLHENKERKHSQQYVHQFDGTLNTGKGAFFSKAAHHNPFHAVADVLENLLKQAQHKHPHKEEWKETLKKKK